MQCIAGTIAVQRDHGGVQHGPTGNETSETERELRVAYSDELAHAERIEENLGADRAIEITRAIAARRPPVLLAVVKPVRR